MRNVPLQPQTLVCLLIKPLMAILHIYFGFLSYLPLLLVPRGGPWGAVKPRVLTNPGPRVLANPPVLLIVNLIKERVKFIILYNLKLSLFLVLIYIEISFMVLFLFLVEKLLLLLLVSTLQLFLWLFGLWMMVTGMKLNLLFFFVQKVLL